MTSAPSRYDSRFRHAGRIAGGYDIRRRKLSKWDVEQSVVREFVAGAQPGNTILDVPFGTGRFAHIYLDRWLLVHGVDSSADMLAQATHALSTDVSKCRLMIADALTLPYEDNTFDYLVCTRFVKWLPELDLVDRALAEFARVCRGLLLIQWNVKRSGLALPMPFKAAAGLGGRKTKYRQSDIHDLCEKNGLRILRDFPLPGGIAKSVHYIVAMAPQDPEGHR